MSENVNNLMLEHLKRFQATLDRVENRLGELTARMSNVEGGLVSVIQHLGHLAAAIATRRITIDLVSNRLDRIEKRLELAN